MGECIELFVPGTHDPFPNMCNYGLAIADTLHLLSDMEHGARRALAQGRDAIEVPVDWVEDITDWLEPSVKPSYEALEFIARWNDLRKYVFSLEAQYKNIPSLLKQAEDFTGRIVEPDLPVEDNELQCVDIETTDACLTFATTTSQLPGQAAVIFSGEIPIDNRIKRIIICEAELEGVDVTNLDDFNQLMLTVAKTIAAKNHSIVLSPEIITEVLTPLKEFALETGPTGILEEQVLDLEEGVVILENEIENYIELLRQTANLLRPLTTHLELSNAYGIHLPNLINWLKKVKALISPQEKRVNEAD